MPQREIRRFLPNYYATMDAWLTRDARAMFPEGLFVMATQNLLQRSLRSLGESVRALRTGEGNSGAAKLNRSARQGVKKAKSGLKNLSVTLGFSAIDAYDDDPDEQQRRRRARTLLSDDAPMVFMQQNGVDGRDLNSTVAPEFRAQVSAGFAAANTYTTGSTLVSSEAGDSDGA